MFQEGQAMDEEVTQDTGSLELEKENTDDHNENEESYPEELDEKKDRLLDDHMSKVTSKKSINLTLSILIFHKSFTSINI